MLKALAAGTCMSVLLFSVGNQVVLAEETYGLETESQTFADEMLQIATAEDFAAYAQNETLKGNYILVNDIDISQCVDAVAGRNLNGTFDGNGHTIFGLQGTQPLFGYIGDSAAVKNLTVEGTLNINSTSFENVAGLCEYNAGTIENCVNRVDINVTGYIARVGGIASQNAGNIIGCRNEGNFYGNMSEAGGIAGLNGGILISDCENTGNITVCSSGESHYVAGGIIGDEAFYLPSDEFEIINCKNSGTIQREPVSSVETVVMGGIIGEAALKYPNATSKITNCVNTGTVSGNGTIGGIAGIINLNIGYSESGGNGVHIASGNYIMESCWNAGPLIVQTYGNGADELSSTVGGLCGFAEIGNSGSISIKNSSNVGSLYRDVSVEGYDFFGGLAGILWNLASEQGVADAYIYMENCQNKGYVDPNAVEVSDQAAITQGSNIVITGCDYSGNTYKTDADGTVHGYTADGSRIINQFVSDGRYTYYFQADGTAMRNRLTYHPDGEHIIYFDANGHEVFDNFANVKKSIAGDPVDDMCYFNTFGYMYVDQTTFTGTGSAQKAYYLNAYGVMQTGGWFKFANGVDIGYANADGTLMYGQFSYDQWGREVYFQADGRIARGLITDGAYYYQMDETDGHLIGCFPVN